MGGTNLKEPSTAFQMKLYLVLIKYTAEVVTGYEPTHLRYKASSIKLTVLLTLASVGIELLDEDILGKDYIRIEVLVLPE